MLSGAGGRVSIAKLCIEPTIWEELRLELARPFVGRWVEAKVVVLALIAGEHAVLFSEPGTAKTTMFKRLKRLVDARFFFYTLFPSTEVEEVLGPGREHIDRFLPGAEIAVLDEIFNAPSQLLNSLLELLADRVIRMEGEEIEAPLWSCFAASNWDPVETGRRELQALYDRFLFRHFVLPIPRESWRLLLRMYLARLAERGDERFAQVREVRTRVGIDWIRRESRRGLAEIARSMDEEVLSMLEAAFEAAESRGVTVTDRRKILSLKAVAAHALYRGASRVEPKDLVVLRFVLPRVRDDETQRIPAIFIEEPRLRVCVEELEAELVEAVELVEQLVLEGDPRAEKALACACAWLTELEALSPTVTALRSRLIHAASFISAKSFAVA